MKGEHMEILSVGDLIELAETGKIKNIELDDMAKVVLHECLYMLKFEKRYYEKGKNKKWKIDLGLERGTK